MTTENKTGPIKSLNDLPDPPPGYHIMTCVYRKSKDGDPNKDHSIRLVTIPMQNWVSRGVTHEEISILKNESR